MRTGPHQAAPAGSRLLTAVETPRRVQVELQATTNERSRTRLWSFRLLTLLLPLAAFALLELVCRWLDVGRPTTTVDPFLGFSEIHPLFEVDPHRDVYRIAPSRRRFFAYESFPVEKPPRSRRVFCLGGSTVKGEPYSIPTSFTTWLELALNTSDGNRDWDVVNCGGISYASYRLVPILEECLRYEPDLFIICTGHNEFLEDRSYGHLKNARSPLAVSQRAVMKSRLVNLTLQALDRIGGASIPETVENRPMLGPDTDPILDYNDSLKAYHWDSEWREGVAAHYEFNLRRMLDLADAAGVPVVLVLPPSNLAGFPPLKSEHHPSLADAQLNRFDEFITAARENYSTDLHRSIDLLRQAVDISPGHAATLYDLGQSSLAAGHIDEARNYLVRARDNDIVPLRMVSELEAAMRRVVEERGVPLIEAHLLLEPLSPHGILGDALLVDHIHPGFDGHQMIAAALTEQLADLSLVSLPDDWRSRAETAWQAHFDALDYPYFAAGQRYLINLEGWTQGHGDGPPAAERFPWRIRDSQE